MIKAQILTIAGTSKTSKNRLFLGFTNGTSGYDTAQYITLDTHETKRKLVDYKKCNAVVIRLYFFRCYNDGRL